MIQEDGARSVRDLAHVVERMRHFQKAYFASRRIQDLNIAQGLERQVDNLVQEILHGQGKLFPHRPAKSTLERAAGHLALSTTWSYPEALEILKVIVKLQSASEILSTLRQETREAKP